MGKHFENEVKYSRTYIESVLQATKMLVYSKLHDLVQWTSKKQKWQPSIGNIITIFNYEGRRVFIENALLWETAPEVW